MGGFLFAALILAVAQAAIMTGVFFISGQLLPTALASVYGHLPTALSRTVAASIFIFPVCNWLAGYAFAHYSPAMVSPLMAAMAVLMNVGMTILIIGVRPSLWIIPAIGLLAGAAVWVSLLLQQKPV